MNGQIDLRAEEVEGVGDINLLKARLTLAYWILGVVAVLLVAVLKTNHNRFTVLKVKLASYQGTRDKQEVLDRVAQLHEQGNQLVGTRIKNPEYDWWKDQVEKWRVETESYLEGNYPFAVHERFSNVVVVPPVPFEHAIETIPDHGYQLSILVRQLQVLDDLRGSGMAL